MAITDVWILKNENIKISKVQYRIQVPMLHQYSDLMLRMPPYSTNKLEQSFNTNLVSNYTLVKKQFENKYNIWKKFEESIHDLERNECWIKATANSAASYGDHVLQNYRFTTLRGVTNKF
ncbi:hypothetical protein LOAG_09487 [Loa loa]|uniref:Uncharacterized protein n=1 Tax=Loa loa TaxID=7209 RepID=A0A1S0TTE6_LOALO|nr:hypothetical protein LOAG_09487 [Loa loa]EFO19009.1 hypothetical protein LOAG_09487 [Loa loa]